MRLCVVRRAGRGTTSTAFHGAQIKRDSSGSTYSIVACYAQGHAFRKGKGGIRKGRFCFNEVDGSEVKKCQALGPVKSRLSVSTHHLHLSCADIRHRSSKSIRLSLLYGSRISTERMNQRNAIKEKNQRQLSNKYLQLLQHDVTMMFRMLSEEQTLNSVTGLH